MCDLSISVQRTDAEAPKLTTWCREPTHWKRPWCWERLRAKEKVITEDKMVGWHHHHLSGRVWTNSKRWGSTGKPGVLQSTGLQTVGHDLATEQQQQLCVTRKWSRQCSEEPEEEEISGVGEISQGRAYKVGRIQITRTDWRRQPRQRRWQEQSQGWCPG